MLSLYKQTALVAALSLAFVGCASTPKKKPEEKPPVEQQQPATSATDTTSGAQTSGLNQNGALDSSAMANANNANSTGNAGNGNSGGSDANSATNGKNGKGGANGTGNGTDLAQLLAQRVVHFDFDSSDVQNADYQTLLAHAQYLKDHSNAKVKLAGHADERGTREYNMALGERRAKSVEAFLSSNGARASQLDTVSYGKEKPVNDGHDESAWAANRRVEISYTTGAPQ